MTDRDRQLMGMLATVRYLSGEQLQRLLFMERSDINRKKRLAALGGEGKHGLEPAYLKRLSYRSWDGVAQSAWCLTKAGYAVAASVLPEPVSPPLSEPGVTYIEHGLLLNELYVQLLEAPVRRALATARERAGKTERPSRAFLRLKTGLFARAAHPGFRWLTHDMVCLPWKELDEKANKTRDRLIRPDATLEIFTPGDGGSRRPGDGPTGARWFLEAETGSQSIRATSDEKRGTTLAKLDQYAEFITGSAKHGEPTWYAKSFPDGLEPRVVFLVPTAGREHSVQRAINDWRKETKSSLTARVHTVEGAAEKLLKLLGETPAAPRKAPRTIVSAEVRLIREFHASTLATMTAVRANAQARGVREPEFPTGTNRMRALLEKLSASR